MTASPYRVDAPVEPNPYDPPTHPALHPVTDPAAHDPATYGRPGHEHPEYRHGEPLGYDPQAYDPQGFDPSAYAPSVGQQAPYDPAYDPGAYADRAAEPHTEVIPVIPAQPGAPDLDPAADPRVAAAWAAQKAHGPQKAQGSQGAAPRTEDSLWEHSPTDRSGWDQGEWDRPDYDDEQDVGEDFGQDFGQDGAHPAEPAARPRRVAALLVPAAVGIAVSVGLGAYARLHEGTGTALNLAGFSSGLAAKSWLTAAAFVLVLVQLWTSMRMYGRLARSRPAGPRTATLHRWSGRVAVLLTIPVAVHCLYALGYADSTPRVLLHSLAGCFFYGAFATKMLVLPKRDAPRWALPVLGGLVFLLLTGLFLTSSVWFFSTKGLTF